MFTATVQGDSLYLVQVSGDVASRPLRVKLSARSGQQQGQNTVWTYMPLKRTRTALVRFFRFRLPDHQPDRDRVSCAVLHIVKKTIHRMLWTSWSYAQGVDNLTGFVWH